MRRDSPVLPEHYAQTPLSWVQTLEQLTAPCSRCEPDMDSPSQTQTVAKTQCQWGNIVTKTFYICTEWHLTRIIKWCLSDNQGAGTTLSFSASKYLILIEIYLKEKFKEKAVSIQDNADKDNTAIKYSQGDNLQLMRCLNLDMHHFAPPLSTLSLTDETGSTKNAFNELSWTDFSMSLETSFSHLNWWMFQFSLFLYG